MDHPGPHVITRPGTCKSTHHRWAQAGGVEWGEGSAKEMSEAGDTGVRREPHELVGGGKIPRKLLCEGFSHDGKVVDMEAGGRIPHPLPAFSLSLLV